MLFTANPVIESGRRRDCSESPLGPQLSCPGTVRRKCDLDSGENDACEWPVWRHLLQCSVYSAATTNKCCVSNIVKCQRPECPHLVNSTPDRCRDIHEWPVEPLRGSTNFFAHAAFFTLRAHAAQNHNGRLGLSPSFRCTLHERPLSGNLQTLQSSLSAHS